MNNDLADSEQSGPISRHDTSPHDDISGLLDRPSPQHAPHVRVHREPPLIPDPEQQVGIHQPPATEEPLVEDPGDRPSRLPSPPKDEEIPEYQSPSDAFGVPSGGGGPAVDNGEFGEPQDLIEDPSDAESLDSLPDGPVNFHEGCNCKIQRLPGGRRRWKTDGGCCESCEEAARTFNAYQDFKHPID